MMTEQEKQLLLKDLCSRLPYDVNAKGNYDVFDDNGNVVKMEATGRVMWISKEYATIGFEGIYYSINCRIDTVKPYLRPMSSMTEKEFYELCELDVSLPPFKDYYGQMQYYGSGGEWSIVDVEIEDIIKYVNYLNAHYFDYNGLIEKGLALEAPEGLYEGMHEF